MYPNTVVSMVMIHMIFYWYFLEQLSASEDLLLLRTALHMACSWPEGLQALLEARLMGGLLRLMGNGIGNLRFLEMAMAQIRVPNDPQKWSCLVGKPSIWGWIILSHSQLHVCTLSCDLRGGVNLRSGVHHLGTALSIEWYEAPNLDHLWPKLI